MDATSLYPRGFHPAHQQRLPNWTDFASPYTRSSAPAPVRYYFSDFGLSTRFPPGTPRLVTGGLGAERDVPELSWSAPYDPFKLDVYVLGKVLKDQIHDVRPPPRDRVTHLIRTRRNTSASASSAR